MKQKKKKNQKSETWVFPAKTIFFSHGLASFCRSLSDRDFKHHKPAGFTGGFFRSTHTNDDAAECFVLHLRILSFSSSSSRFLILSDSCFEQAKPFFLYWRECWLKRRGVVKRPWRVAAWAKKKSNTFSSSTWSPFSSRAQIYQQQDELLSSRTTHHEADRIATVCSSSRRTVNFRTNVFNCWNIFRTNSLHLFCRLVWPGLRFFFRFRFRPVFAFRPISPVRLFVFLLSTLKTVEQLEKSGKYSTKLSSVGL